MIPLSHLHPMLVHFPVALVTIGFLAQIASLIFKKEVCLSNTAFYLLVCGTLGALAAWLTGALFTGEMAGSAGEIREYHEHAATVTLLVLLIASALSISMKVKGNTSINMQRMVIVLYGLATIAVGITGFLGGTLVFNYMMPL
ncbi:MAG: hypothetical protein Q8909_11805 [Bacteroidota bacterium]|nr:hypothetical protein [Bacteroidota bacterium]